jgi:hypothetical protein
MAGANQNLRHDVAAVGAYGAAHPGSFVGLRIGSVGVTVAFTTAIASHRQALKEIVRDPESLVVEQRPYSRTMLENIRSELAREWHQQQPRQHGGLAVGYDTVEVTLDAQSEGLAEEVLARYGSALTMRVGFKGVPVDISQIRQVDMPTPDLKVDGLTLEVELAEDRIAAGATARGRIWFLNTSDSQIEVETDSVVAGGIRLPGSSEVTGWFAGQLRGTGAFLNLPPGGRRPIKVVIGTASSEPNDEYIPTRGEYEVVVGVNVRVKSKLSDQHGVMLADGPQLILI